MLQVRCLGYKGYSKCIKVVLFTRLEAFTEALDYGQEGVTEFEAEGEAAGQYKALLEWLINSYITLK